MDAAPPAQDDGRDEPAPAARERRWPAALRPARAFVILLAAAFLSLLAYGLVNESNADAIDQALVRGASAPAPDFELAVLSPGSGELPVPVRGAMADGRLSMGELRGTAVVLNLWSSWCPPCRTEQPDLERAWRAERRRDGAVFLGLDQQDLTGDARAYIDELSVTYPQVRDPGDEVARRYGATGLPETYFIDPRGQVVGHVIGAVSPAQLRAGVEAARTSRLLGARAGGERREVR
jgi:cytochrome c biogenesis protein CcmG/thiol:disulfide interchange protein DsbE